MTKLRHAALFLALLAAPAAAQDATNTVVYYRAGNWEAFNGTAANGSTFCGIKTAAMPDGRGMMIRFRTGDDRLIFRVRKPSWAIPAGTAISVSMQFGPIQPWTLNGTGEQDVVEWSIPQTAMPEFDAQFRQGAVLWIGFPGGNEHPWNVSLAGSNAIGLTLGRCMRELAALAVRTQPFGSNASSPAQGGAQQPPPGQPSQPFTAAPPPAR